MQSLFRHIGKSLTQAFWLLNENKTAQKLTISFKN